METWPTSAWSCLKEQVVLVLTEPEMNDRLPGADAEVVETVYEMNFTYFFLVIVLAPLQYTVPSDLCFLECTSLSLPPGPWALN